ncbi:glycosyltransferase family 4 protein [Polynucleobacter sp. MWH-Braz-FAM2G]|uniref:glycosyltransferase family 4 protein n=1 Tax=Polynucleobacter sp. MWH-Braz-FAM2G TaxID=1855883 RepID=UPI001BFE19C8|nr:glycosyltransferase family 4 protein [Polynucleobacter sp. MWH-Braz-FAM2G]QWD91074.1 glycosyltransferase family 4 protein [Polynucleobacter sp. MWH-Braz-FAM2G]
MIRVLMIVPRFESTGRGVEVFARYLATGLDKARFSVTILSGIHSSVIPDVDCIQFPIVTRETLSAKFINRILKFLPARFLCTPVDLESLSLVWRARHYLRNHSFDVILPFGGTWTYRFANWYKKDAKIISVGHAGPLKADLAVSDFFVALTPTDEEQANQLAPHVSTKVIPNGVDLKAFYPSTLSKKNLARQTILCVGAFSDDKRQDLLLDALAFLDPKIHCILVGKGPRKKLLEEHPQARSGRVQFMELPHQKMPHLYQQADVFSLPAPYEAFGLVFLEALASGLPVVANDGPRQRFVIGDEGIFCDVTDPKAYARALEVALALPSATISARQVNKFSWQDIIGQYEQLLLDINGNACHGAKKDHI